MADSQTTDPSQWMHPDQLMKLHRLKMKTKALKARMNNPTVENKPAISKEDTSLSSTINLKRKNPFAKTESEKKVKNVVSPEIDTSQDATLFKLLHIENESIKTQKSVQAPISFADVLTKINTSDSVGEIEIPMGKEYIPMDWTLNTKMRIMSFKPFPWTGTCKTSEEASGTTGFVRCLDIGENKTTLDTSPNARFHQCCLIWQHPSIPWLQLFPRTGNLGSSSTGGNGINNQLTRDSLFNDWCESYRSLFHLVRARQCPYFYLCGNSFTVLFRAAGICGIPEIHALITPTTRGLRQALKQEDIEFTMPLKPTNKRHSGTDSGFDSLNSTNSTLQDNDLTNHLDEDDDDEDEEKWLASMGIDQKLISKTKHRMTILKESEVDNLKQSLVFVTGVEVQGLFNFLLNCKSIIPVSGPLAGVPPTLLSPVAFHNASLRPIKVKSSIVGYENEKYYSLELKGPLLPHVLPSLCNLMKSSQMDQFTVSCAHLTSTTAFSTTKHGKVQPDVEKNENLPQSVFGQEGLSDCGFSQKLLTHFCNSDPSRIEVVESLKFASDSYIWN